MRAGPTRPAFGREAARSLLAVRPALSAFLVASPRQLLGVLQALREARIAIPAQVSVIGYGDAEWFELTDPPISGIALPVAAMSERATALLFASLDGGAGQPRGQAGVQLFAAAPVVRASTAPPRAG